MPKPLTSPKHQAYSVKSMALLEPLIKAYKAALLEASDKDNRSAIAYWYRENKALALLEGGDITPKTKCKKCRGRGKYLMAIPNKGGPYQDEDFKPHACECVVALVNLPNTEDDYQLAKKEKLEKDAKISSDAGNLGKPNNELGKPKQRVKRPKPEIIKEKTDSGTTNLRPKKEEETGAPVKKVRKRKNPDQSNPEETKNIT